MFFYTNHTNIFEDLKSQTTYFLDLV